MNDIYEQLAKMAGPKPVNKRRKALNGLEKQSIIYLMWTAKTANVEYEHAISTPEQVYMHSENATFINKCKKRGLNWALLSPVHGVWLPNDEYSHDSRRPQNLSAEERKELVRNIDEKLVGYERIVIYTSGIFDRTELHRQVMEQSRLHDCIADVHSLKDVGAVYT